MLQLGILRGVKLDKQVPKKLWIIIPIITFLAIVAFLVIEKANQSRSNLPTYGEVPDFAFKDSQGKQFGRDELLGKISIIDFFFTSCRGPCPVMSSNMAELYQAFSTSDQVQLVSISVDPEVDTPEVLNQYAEAHGVTDNRWRFLRADLAAVIKLSEKGFHLAAENLPSMHSTKFILVDENAEIRGYYSGTDEASMKILISDVRQLVKKIE
ncbi:MAG: redoxin domain-containing protein [candidate division Zixibacteria bacterium]|nr:redoxin domain-containing protein [candidate division Zixibacteria bacterium]